MFDRAKRFHFEESCGGKAPWFEITDDLPQFTEYEPDESYDVLPEDLEG